MLLDGFDLVVLGTVPPVLLQDKEWGLTPGGAGVVSTAGLAGMMLGALAIGTVTDVIGRRKALWLLLTLNLGAVIGLVIAGAVADRVGVRPATVFWFAASAVALGLLSVRLPGVGVYAAVLVAGCFVFSAQVLVYAYVGRVYGDRYRATGLGWTAGIGRIGPICGPLLGGAMLTAGIAYPWGFYAFALVAAVGVVAVLAVGVRSAVGVGGTVGASARRVVPEADRR